MYEYVIRTILSKGLPYHGHMENLVHDPKRYVVNGLSSTINPMSYFLFKAAYEKDIRYTKEDILNYDDFREYLPIGK